MLSKMDIFNIIKEQLKNAGADLRPIEVEDVTDSIIERLVEEGLYDEEAEDSFVGYASRSETYPDSFWELEDEELDADAPGDDDD